MAVLLKRTLCQDRYGYTYQCSAWDSWVRWLVLVLVVLGFLFLFCCLSCLSARRRRRAGQQPFYGTGWTANNQWGNRHHGQQQYPQQNPQNSYYAYQQPAPPYESSPAPGQPAYRGEQMNGIELAAPGPTYGGGYQPPPGPPPKKY